MTRITTLNSKQLFAVALGLSFICATTGPALPATPKGLESSMTAYPLDGIYKGHTEPFAANNEACRPGQAVALEVRNGRFKWAWNERQLFDAMIRPDGTFYADHRGLADSGREAHDARADVARARRRGRCCGRLRHALVPLPAGGQPIIRGAASERTDRQGRAAAVSAASCSHNVCATITKT
jgi:hypothetical protein